MTNNNDLERRIDKAFKAATPNVLDEVLRDCEQTKGRTIMITENRKVSWAKKAVAIAAAVAIILTGAFGISTYVNNNSVTSIVSLDVNPSIEIEVNKQEKVLAVNPLNDDGKKVIGEMDFKGSDIDVVINALIGSMLREGYLNDLANSILISVDGDDIGKSEELQARLAQEIDNLLHTDDFTGSVLSQTVNHDTELDTLAEQYGITAGKAQLIRQITSQNTHYTFEDLAALSINELNLLNNGNTLDNVTSTGTASDKKYVGAEAAKQAALAHAGVNESDIRGYECELDYEKGVMLYEIEFEVGGYDYDYEINANDCTVVRHQKDHDDDCRDENCDHASHASGNHHSGTAASSNNDQNNQSGDTQQGGDSQNNTNQSGTATATITREEAIVIALEHAGVKESEAYEVECERDVEHGITVYEVEFESGSYDYNYEVDVETGAVVKHSKKFDNDNVWDNIENALDGNAGTQSEPSDFIGKDAAKTAALEHAGVSASDIRGFECEFDGADDIFEKDHYDIEFSSGGYDYEYEIDAETGKVLKSEKERDD